MTDTPYKQSTIGTALAQGDSGRLAELHERIEDGRGQDVGRKSEAV